VDTADTRYPVMLESRPRVSPSPHHGREAPPARRDVTEARPPLLHKACHVTRTGTVWQFRPLALLSRRLATCIDLN